MPVKHLDLKADIRPEDSFLHVEGLVVASGFDDTVDLLLNPCFELLNIEYTSDNGFQKLEFTEQRPPDDVFMPAASYEIRIPEELQQQNSIDIRVEYQGRLYRYFFDTSRIREKFIELAIYGLWYPITSFSDRISYRLHLNAPEDWTWIANAPQVSDDLLIWQSKSPRIDITLHGRPAQDAISPDDSDLFWGSPRNLKSLRPLEADFKPFKKLIRNWLGPTDNDDLKIVLVSRDFGGGYSRSGLVVLQDDIGDDITESKKKSILKYWAHEYAHFWWRKTTVEDYHNWIDEALAEYTARLACENILGEEYFEDSIQGLRDALREEESLPPIKEIRRQHPKAKTVFYVYGALIFHEIREKIGKESFLEFLYSFAQKEIKAEKIITSDLVATLEETTGLEWQDYVDERISMEPRTL
ncbi:MAG: M1 family aminopeptidase [Candidatus Thorarchaeota archaeon]